jgi:hypothetical protein
MTAWVEADNGYGIGEYFEIQSYGVNVIYNGYQSSPSNWKANSRVQKFKVYRDGRPICYLVLTDEMGAQYFELPNFQYEEEESIWRFEIVDVFPGSKWADVAISEISNRGCCVASNTVIEGFNDVSIDQLSKGAEVDALDLNSGKSFKVKVNSVSKSIHLSLYRIETESSSLDLTHDHPIYIKGEEFISISQYMIKNKIDDLDALIGKIDFGIYDEKSSQIKFEKLKNIKIIEGFFETYTINQMAGGETFITNGFISKVY